MTMMLRRAMMEPAGGGGLPAAYQQVEYLQSSGTQYVDTGVTFNTGIKINAKMAYVSFSSANTLFGARTTTGATRFLVAYYNGLDFAYGGDHVLTNYSVAADKIIDIIYDTTAQGSITYGVPGNTVTATYADVNTNVTGYIFAYHRASDDSVQGWSSSRFYSMSIKDADDELLFDGIPCIRIADNKPGIYDFVSGSFLTNAGSGDFIIPT